MTEGGGGKKNLRTSYIEAPLGGVTDYSGGGGEACPTKFGEIREAQQSSSLLSISGPPLSETFVLGGFHIVRTGWGEGGPKKQTRGTKSAEGVPKIQAC